MSEPKSYSYQEALSASTEYFNGNELAASVFLDKYALRDNEDNLLESTPDAMHRRIAKEFARVEAKKYAKSKKIKPLTEEQIYKLLYRFGKIVPQGSPMYGIGNTYQTISLSNCFVVESPLDSYTSILKADEELAQIAKRRGGDGIDVANIRPAGVRTHNAARTATGTIPFCGRYSNTIREVGQNGRRGALMISQSIHHPESVIPWNPEIDGEEFFTEIKDKDLGQFKISSRYFNPKKIDFATMKYDRSKVTGANVSLRVTDEFLNAVEAETTYEQRWPVENRVNPVIRQAVDAVAVWDKIIHSAWQTAEPGVLFWDNILRESPADCYADVGFKTISTNPCTVAETIVYVADGRGNVSIGDLAREGKDVPVFCFDNDGKVAIRTMRHPRVTGYKQPIFKLTLEDGFTFRVTGNHKFRLTDGTYRETKDLQPGDSVKTLTRYEASWDEIFPTKSRSQDYLWIAGGKGATRPEHAFIAEHAYGDIKKGHVVHHKDDDAKNNVPSNLQVMTREAHDEFHKRDKLGDANPMRRAQTEWSDEKWAAYSKNMTAAIGGENNGRYSGITTAQIITHAEALIKKIGRRFSKSEWMSYAEEHGLPQAFSKMRRAEGLTSPTDLGRQVAERLGVDSDEDPRLQRTLAAAREQGYAARIDGNAVIVDRVCEQCGCTFQSDYFRREIGFCSRSCSNLHLNARGTNDKRTQSINETYSKKMEGVKQGQLLAFTKLRFELGRDPLMTEWEASCKSGGLSCRIGTKHGFESYEKLKEDAAVFNHRVISVERDGEADVYNGTVDEFHNFFVGAWEGKTKSGKRKWLYGNNLQCGEIPLSAYDSCRLLVLNLFQFVKNPYTKDAYFDYADFYAHAQIAQRLMDDLVDLEGECIRRIIAKITADPEPLSIKHRELELWNNILTACLNGRRTGTGITALGDAIAACGIGYGTEDGVAMTEAIYKTLKFGAYRASIDMAKELGAFPVWNHEKEKNNPFLNRFKGDVLLLSSGPKSYIQPVRGEDLWEDMKQFGRRNIALLTTAPTGSVSLVTRLTEEFGTSSGIEPQYDITPYTRKKKGNPGDKNFRVDETDQNGDHWMFFPVYCSALKEWIAATGEEDFKKSPWWNNCASQLDWNIRVRLQAAAQRHVDHSISSTVNLPNDVTVAKVDEIYRTAWKAGCKGITVYRDGCRSGVLVKDLPKKAEPEKVGYEHFKEKLLADLTAEQKLLISDESIREIWNEASAPKSIQKTTAPKRPGVLPCDVYHIKAKGQEYFVLVGLLDGEPYEVFAGRNGMIAKSVKKGTLTRKARGKYIAQFDDGSQIDSVVDHIEDDEEAITRLVSTSLRHGADIEFIVHQLECTKGNLVAFSKALVRALKKYIPDGKVVGGEVCEQEGCGGQLIRQDGCKICRSCSWTKCG